MKIKPLYFFVLLASLAGIHQAAAQGTTAFTYQGQLRDGGTNANGAYAMTFRLYDAVSGGGQIGNTTSNSPILANGLFSVNLDFGAGAFNGAARWLDITVQAGTNTAETLTPRVQVLPTPYAQFAAVAASVTNGAITTAQIAGGQVVKSLNGLSDNMVLSAGANAALFANGNTLQLSASVPNIQKFTSNGTFIVPTNVTRVMVELWGGGGGGGGTASPYAGGGGGSGGYSLKSLNVTAGASYTVTAGAGGSPSIGGAASSFGALASVGGGLGGSNAGVSAPGVGGSGGTPGNSGPGQSGSVSDGNSGGNGASAVRGGSGGWGNQDQKNGQEPGGGGGGGVNGVQSGVGGYGASGWVIVYY